jgi:hypothetical protein
MKPKPTSATWVWWGGAVVIFIVGFAVFAADGHWGYAAVAVVGAIAAGSYCVTLARR